MASGWAGRRCTVAGILLLATIPLGACGARLGSVEQNIRIPGWLSNEIEAGRARSYCGADGRASPATSALCYESIYPPRRPESRDEARERQRREREYCRSAGRCRR